MGAIMGGMSAVDRAKALSVMGAEARRDAEAAHLDHKRRQREYRELLEEDLRRRYLDYLQNPNGNMLREVERKMHHIHGVDHIQEIIKVVC
jgi:hypothetical protein